MTTSAFYACNNPSALSNELRSASWRFRIVECRSSCRHHFIVVRVCGAAVERTAPPECSARQMLLANHESEAALIAFNPELELMVFASISSIDTSGHGVRIRRHRETFCLLGRPMTPGNGMNTHRDALHFFDRAETRNTTCEAGSECPASRVRVHFARARAFAAQAEAAAVRVRAAAAPHCCVAAAR